MKRLLFIVLFSLLACAGAPTQAQDAPHLSFWQPADTLHKTRFWLCAGGGSALYGAVSIGLYNAWYKGYELTAFHLFDDWGEWRHMDKAGHLFTAHMESTLAFKGALWTGINRRTAMWTGFGVGMLLQSTVEVMDGFSAKWGFSLSDMGFNLLGSSLFLAQEAAWHEQRILMKTSYTEPRHASEPIYSTDGQLVTTLYARARELYGISYPERFLKGYNGLTVWASVNPTSFWPKPNRPVFLPQWLNIAVGYGAENLYGGFDNQWQSNGATFRADPLRYPRYSQFYLSLDVDFTRIPTRSYFLKTVFNVINWIKVPAPTIEYNTIGNFRVHPVMW